MDLPQLSITGLAWWPVGTSVRALRERLLEVKPSRQQLDVYCHLRQTGPDWSLVVLWPGEPPSFTMYFEGDYNHRLPQLVLRADAGASAQALSVVSAIRLVLVAEPDPEEVLRLEHEGFPAVTVMPWPLQPQLKACCAQIAALMGQHVEPAGAELDQPVVRERVSGGRSRVNGRRPRAQPARRQLALTA